MKNVKNGKGKIGNEYDEDVNLNVRNVRKRKITDWACFCSDWNDHLGVPFVIVIVIVLIEVGELPEYFLKIRPLHIGQHFLKIWPLHIGSYLEILICLHQTNRLSSHPWIFSCFCLLRPFLKDD
jgi:hypothetical protein